MPNPPQDRYFPLLTSAEIAALLAEMETFMHLGPSDEARLATALSTGVVWPEWMNRAYALLLWLQALPGRLLELMQGLFWRTVLWVTTRLEAYGNQVLRVPIADPAT